MKNLYLLPTDKPSRLIKSQDNDFVYLNTNAPNWFENNLKTIKQNIYITNDEEIKEGDYVICDNKLYKIIVTGVLYNDDFTLQTDIEGVFLNPKYCRKIILTTDQDLIKNGVQAIDDEFLEWFVKNSSCEEVEVVSAKTIPALQLTGNGHCWWKIIIPQEEPKQETLEEAAMKIYPIKTDPSGYDINMFSRYGFYNGAKWQSEGMYTIEDLERAFTEGFNARYRMEDGVESRHKFIEQFKKK